MHVPHAPWAQGTRAPRGPPGPHVKLGGQGTCFLLVPPSPSPETSQLSPLRPSSLYKISSFPQSHFIPPARIWAKSCEAIFLPWLTCFKFCFSNWSINALPGCAAFCWAVTWTSYMQTYRPLSLSSTPTPPPGHHGTPGWAPRAVPQPPLIIHFTHVAYLSRYCSIRPTPSLLAVSTVRSLCLCLYSCPADRLISIVSLDSIHMH